MRKSLLFLLGAALMAPQLQAAVENQSFCPPQTPNGSYTAQLFTVPFQATGFDFVKDEYGQVTNPKDGAYSIGMWYKAVGTGGNYSLNHIFAIAKDATECSTWTHYMISCDSDGNYFFNVKENDGGLQEDPAFDYTSTAPNTTRDLAYCLGGQLTLGKYAMGEWHHMIIAVDNAAKKLRIFVDGTLDTEANLTAPLLFGKDYLFKFGYNGGTGNVFDEVQIYNRALTAEDAAAAYENAADVQGVTAIYTINGIAEGTEGTFKNQLIGGTDVDGVVYLMQYTNYWGVPYNYYMWKSKSEYAPTLGEGRDLTGKTVTVTLGDIQNGTVTLTPVDVETAINSGANNVELGATYTVTATPAAGYALASLKAKTVNGDVVLASGSTVCFLGNTEISATFSNDFKTLNFVNEHNVPFVVYHNNIQVATSDDASLDAIVGETYKLVFDVPFSVILNGIKVNGQSIEAVDNACEFTVTGTTGDITIDATLKEAYAITINQPVVDGVVAGTITVTASDGTVVENGDKVIVGDKLTAAFEPVQGYRFCHFIINGEPTAANSIIVEDAVSFDAQAEVGNEYPAMTRTFSNKIGQQNRYIKSMSQEGVQEPLFFAKTQEELGAEYWPGPAGAYLPNGAVINKTGIRANPFTIDEATTEFTFTFTPWSDPIITEAGSLNTEFGWTKYAVFVDWNNDGDFTDEGEIAAVDDAGMSSTKYDDPAVCTKTVAVPEGTVPGKYRMRIVFYESNSAWYETVFETCQILNGVAYDFDVVMGSAHLDEARTVSVKVNDEKAGSAEIVDVPDMEAGATTVTTDWKYIKMVATANEGAKLVNWTDKAGSEVGSETAYTYSGAEANEITANFGYQVNYEAAGEGSLTVSVGDVNYANGAYIISGSEVRIIPTPTSNQYIVETLTVNGEEVTLAEDGTYTFTMTGTTTISATFAERKFHLTLTHTGNGTVTVGAEADAAGDAVSSIFEGDEITEDVAFFVACKPLGDDSVVSITYTLGDETVEVPVSDLPAYSDEVDAWVIEPKGVGFYIEGLKNDVLIHANFTGVDAIDGVEFDAENGEVEYYNLQGVKVAAENLTNGFYIVRQGNKAAKVLINK